MNKFTVVMFKSAHDVPKGLISGASSRTVNLFVELSTIASRRVAVPCNSGSGAAEGVDSSAGIRYAKKQYQSIVSILEEDAAQ